MTALDDRLLEFALREVLRPTVVEVDSTTAVELRLAAAVHVPRKRGHRRRWPLVAAAAAATIVVAVALAQPEPAATVDGEVLVAAPRGAFTAQRAVAPGSVLWVRTPAPATLRESDGTTLRLQEAAAIERRGAGSYRVLAGHVRLSSPDTVRCDAGLASIAAAPGTTFVVELPPVPDSPEPPMHLDGFLSSLSALPTTFTLTVLLGSAEVMLGQERSRVEAGQSTRVQDPGAARAEAAKAMTLLAGVARDWPKPVDEASTVACKQLADQETELGMLLLRSVPARKAVAQALGRAIERRDASDELLGRVVRLACLSDDKELAERCSAAFARQPGAFGIEERIALAEKGNEAVRPHLHEALRETDGQQAVMIAAALAAGGDKTALPLLAPRLRPTVAAALADTGVFDAKCAAAAVYAALGRTAPRTQLLADLEQAVVAAEGTPQSVAAAIACVPRACYFFGATQPRFSHVALRMQTGPVASLANELDAAKALAVVRRLSATQ